MYYHNCLCFICDCRLYLISIYIVVFIRFYKDRSSTIFCNTKYCCNISICLYNDFITLTNSKCSYRHNKCIKSGI